MPYTYDYPRAALTVDCVILGRAPSGASVLLVRRAHDPFRGSWALPGGFVEIEETLLESARRELEEETGLTRVPLQPLGVFDAVDRDPRERVISMAFYAIVDAKEHAARAGDDAVEVRWFPLDALPELAFDHARIIAAASERTRTRLVSRSRKRSWTL